MVGAFPFSLFKRQRKSFDPIGGKKKIKDPIKSTRKDSNMCVESAKGSGKTNRIQDLCVRCS